jgi:hypothetical protein
MRREMDHEDDRATSVFWDDLADDLQDPEHLTAYIEETHIIQTLDGIANATMQNDSSEHNDR